VAECQLPKLDVAGSNPVGRSKSSKGLRAFPQPFGVFTAQNTAHVNSATMIHRPARLISSATADPSRRVRLGMNL
jgi:hypothetical protein